MLEMLKLSVFLPASPEQIYRAWLDSAGHSAITGSPAQVDPQVGGQFSAWDGYIQGRNLEMQPFRRILQTWRTSDFPPESADSRLEVLLEAENGGTRLTLIHTGIPTGQGQDYEQGWEDFYFASMREYYSIK